MARIRTIKPEFFRDEILNDLEGDYPHLRPMLVFAALWGHCDKQGVFEWNPRQLALDILPFLWSDTSGAELSETLDLLYKVDRCIKYEHAGKWWGYIPTFSEHQRITGKEGTEPPKYPPPPDLEKGTHRGHNGDTPETRRGSQEGKGREGRGKGKGKETPPKVPPYAREFDLFWEAYPLKVGKKAALKAFQARRREGVTLEEITEGLSRYLAFKNATRQNLHHPSTFLGPNEWWREPWNIPEGSQGAKDAKAPVLDPKFSRDFTPDIQPRKTTQPEDPNPQPAGNLNVNLPSPPTEAEATEKENQRRAALKRQIEKAGGDGV